MKECDNSKTHTSSNFVFSICLLVMLDTYHYTATLRYTSPHFTQLHFTTLIDTSLPLTYTSLPSHLAYDLDKPGTSLYRTEFYGTPGQNSLKPTKQATNGIPTPKKERRMRNRNSLPIFHSSYFIFGHIPDSVICPQFGLSRLRQEHLQILATCVSPNRLSVL